MLVSAAAFGTLPILARTAYASGADPVGLMAVRFAIGATVMTLVMAVQRRPWPRRGALAGLVALGGIGYVGQSLAFFTALTLIPATLVALLLYLYPAGVALLAAAFLGDRLTPPRVGALFAALTGTALIIGAGGVGGQGRTFGIVLAALAGIVYSVYIVIGSRLTTGAGPLGTTSTVLLAAAVVYLSLAIVTRAALPGDAGGWLAAAALGVIGTVVAVVTFFAGMARIGPADASTLSTFEPVVTAVLAMAVLGERLRPLQIAGGVLVLAAVVALARSGGPHMADAEPPA